MVELEECIIAPSHGRAKFQSILVNTLISIALPLGSTSIGKPCGPTKSNAFLASWLS